MTARPASSVALARQGRSEPATVDLPILPGEIPLAALGPRSAAATGRVLVAGVGDVFCGDDGFGVEVAHRLLGRDLPAGVEVVDFGVRGFDLACALGAAEAVILVDAYPHGRPPGDLTVIEPDLAHGDEPTTEEPTTEDPVDGPGVDPASLLRLARAMNSLPSRLLLVGCQPGTSGLDGFMGLSAPVKAAVIDAVELIESLAADLVRQ